MSRYLVRSRRRAGRLLLPALVCLAALLAQAVGTVSAADFGSRTPPAPASSSPATGKGALLPDEYEAAVLADSPSAYWPLARLGGTVSGADNSKHGNQITFVGSPRIVTGPAVAAFSTAVRLDGSEAGVERSRTPLQTVARWSIEAWVNLASVPQRAVIVYNGTYGSDGGYGFGIGTAGARPGPGPRLIGLLGTRGIDSGYTFTTVRRWHHVVMTRDGSTIRFYVDGRQTAKQSTAGVTTPAPNLTIGGAVTTAGSVGSGLDGEVAQVAMYPSALGGARVLAHYQSTYQGQPGPAIAARPVTAPKLPAAAPKPPATATAPKLPAAVRPRAQSDLTANGPLTMVTSYEYTASLDASGNVWEWGSTPDEARWVPQSADPDLDQGLPSTTGIAAGSGYLLALASDGTVRAQGVNGEGQLGNGTTTDSTAPVTVAGLTGVTAVSTSGESASSFAIKSDGTVWGWGSDDACQLGNGTQSEAAVTHPVEASGLTSVTSMAALSADNLALRADGTVWGWGINFENELGNLPTTEICTPEQVPGVSNVTAVTGADGTSYALESDGSVWIWGDGPFILRTDGNDDVIPNPTQLAMPEPMVAIAAGEYHVLGLGADGTVWAWGLNDRGQLGNGTTTSSVAAVQVPGLTGVRSIFAGGEQSFAVENDGSVWAWGSNYYGQLGDGTTTDQHAPVRVLLPPPLQVSLAPYTQSGPAGSPLPVVASVVDASGAPAANISVGFQVLQGPDQFFLGTTGSDGTATDVIPGAEGGTDIIQANVMDSFGVVHWSNVVSVVFSPPPGPATQVLFVHGWHSNQIDIALGTAYTALVQGMKNAGATVAAFSYYQDLAYRQPDGSCDPAMPDADTNTGTLPVQPDALSTTVCDSESDPALNAAMLDDQLAQFTTPVSLVSDSLGGAVVRGWLALAQERSDTHTVSDVIFHHGVQQGVYFLNSYVDAKNSAFAPLVDYLVKNVAGPQGYDITRPAGHDIIPRSDWFVAVNSVPLPAQLHYYNFYTDIQVHLTQYCLYWQCGDLGTYDAGDAVLLPGNPDPAATPRTGGAEFLPGLQSTPDRRQFVTSQTIEAVSSGGDDLTGALLLAGAQVVQSPLQHVNAGTHAGDGQVQVDSCTGGGQVTVVSKIDYIIANPANGCT